MSSETQVPVLIIGGGIVGLSAALFLAHHGIQSMVIERHQGTSIHPRSRSANARTMELFRRLGIDDHIREAVASLSASKGIHSGPSLKEVVEAKKRTEANGKLPFTGLFEPVSPVFGTFVTQDLVEPVLLDVGMKRGVVSKFYTECLGVEQDESTVTATLKDRKTGVTSTIRAEY